MGDSFQFCPILLLYDVANDSEGNIKLGFHVLICVIEI